MNGKKINKLMNSIKEFFLFFKVSRFYKKYPDIYIYGCGFYGNEVANCFERWGMIYGGFIVSKYNSEARIIRFHKIIEFDANLFQNPSIGIIMGMNKENTSQVMNIIPVRYKSKILRGFECLKI